MGSFLPLIDRIQSIGVRQMAIKRTPQPLGRGIGSRTTITVLVSLVIMMNAAGLVLSIAPVTRGVLDDFQSSTWGEIGLPYLPMEGDPIKVIPDREPVADTPFMMVIEFPDGRLPYLEHRLVLFREAGIWEYPIVQFINSSMGTYCNGLPLPGQYTIGLERRIEGRADLIEVGKLTLLVRGNGSLLPIPMSRSSELTDQPITFQIPGPGNGTIVDVQWSLNEVAKGRFNGAVEEFELTFDPLDMDRGDNWINIRSEDQLGNIDHGSFLYINEERSPEPPRMENLAFKRVFEGTSELYDQVPDDWIDGFGKATVGLYQNEYYFINISSPLHEEGKEPYTSVHRLHIDSDGRKYPLFFDGNGSFRGTIHIPVSFNGAERISIISSWYDRQIVLDHVEIKLKRDRASVVQLDPDPFELGFYDGPLPSSIDLLLYAEWADFNRRDFRGEPFVILEEDELESSDDETIFLYEKNYTLTMDDYSSGRELSIRSDTSFEYGTLLTFLLPGPRIIYFIPAVLEGPAALTYFLLISLSIFISIGLLFWQSCSWKGKGTDDKKMGDWRRIMDIFQNDSPVVITSKTIAGAMFFFYMSFWMFRIFDTPTPGLDILSSENPIWLRMFTLAEASVWEEVSGRIILIGIPLAIVGFIRTKRISSIRQVFGGGNNFGGLEVFLIVLSGSLFGIAHLGWGPWKVLPTFIHGLLFGYLFIKVGLHATIVMHFFFDYTAFLPELTGVGNWTYFFFFLTMLALGGFFLGDIIRSSQVWLSRRTSRRLLRPELLLAVHSLVCLWLASILIDQGGPRIYINILLTIPVLDFIAYIVSIKTRDLIGSIKDDKGEDESIRFFKAALDYAGRFLCYIASYLSLAGSAFGFGWIVSRKK